MNKVTTPISIISENNSSVSINNFLTDSQTVTIKKGVKTKNKIKSSIGTP